MDIKKKQSLSRDTKSEIDSDSGKSEDSNCKQSINESECISNCDHVPNVLEIMDFATKTYRVSPVALKRSPMMMCFIGHVAVPIILDTGAENNVIGDVTCKRLGLRISQTSSQAQQVDRSPLKSVGRVLFQRENGENSWLYDGLVCS